MKPYMYSLLPCAAGCVIYLHGQVAWGLVTLKCASMDKLPLSASTVYRIMSEVPLPITTWYDKSCSNTGLQSHSNTNIKLLFCNLSYNGYFMENLCDSFAARDILCKASWVLCHEAFAHYTQNCKTCSYVPSVKEQICEQASYTLHHINRAKLFTENSAMARLRDIPRGWGSAVPLRHT